MNHPYKMESLIRKAVRSYIGQFNKEVSTEFGVDEKALMELWEDVVKRRPKKEKKERPLSPYQQFCSIHRPVLKEGNPSLSFGELNQELARLWKEHKFNQ